MWPVESFRLEKPFASDCVSVVLRMEAMEFSSRTLAIAYQSKRTDEQDEPRVIFSLAPTPPPLSFVTQNPLALRMAIQAPPHGRPTGATHATVTQRAPMAASLRSLPPVPAAFRRSRAVVRASSSSSSSAVSSSSSTPKARFVARRSESVSVQQLSRPLALGTAFFPSSPQTSCSP